MNDVLATAEQHLAAEEARLAAARQYALDKVEVALEAQVTVQELETSIERLKSAIEILCGAPPPSASGPDIRGTEVSPAPHDAGGAAAASSGLVNRAVAHPPAPSKPTGPVCKSCGSVGTLVQMTQQLRGREIGVLQCSECKSESLR